MCPQCQSLDEGLDVQTHLPTASPLSLLQQQRWEGAPARILGTRPQNQGTPGHDPPQVHHGWKGHCSNGAPSARPQASRALPGPHPDPQQSRRTRIVLLWWDYISEGSHCGTRESGRGIHLFPWVFLMFQFITWHPTYVTAVSWPLSDDGITSNLSQPFFIIYLTIFGCSHTQLKALKVVWQYFSCLIYHNGLYTIFPSTPYTHKYKKYLHFICKRHSF